MRGVTKGDGGNRDLRLFAKAIIEAIRVSRTQFIQSSQRDISGRLWRRVVSWKQDEKMGITLCLGGAIPLLIERMLATTPSSGIRLPHLAGMRVLPRTGALHRA